MYIICMFIYFIIFRDRKKQKQKDVRVDIIYIINMK